MYAILDIETTGGQFNEEGITEIAIYKFDGHNVVEQFISLVNPEIPIQPFVVKLTGINNAMLRSAPKFYEIAKRIIEITEGCVIVAHNASFDYRILRTEFRRLAYDFEKPTLCTVELSKKLIPEMPSYSLGKLVRSLGIPVTDRHRASGDALATVKLFKMLLAKDTEKHIVKSFIKTEIKTGLSPKLLDIVESLPSKTGIFYIHNEKGELIYIGKSKNIKKSVNQIFTRTSSKYKKIQVEVYAVTFEETGSELIAILKENEEIRINKPIYSRQQNHVFKWALYQEKTENGYISLQLKKTDRRKKEIISFSTQTEGENALLRISEKYNLSKRINQLPETEKNTETEKPENPETYNQRVLDFIKKNTFDYQNMLIIDYGRNINERSVILIEDKKYKGYSYFDLNFQITNIEILRNLITPTPFSFEAKHIIKEYLRKKKVQKIIRF
ncbi:MAG: exonuclease domain-containing protein [Flavobacteriaceae bacterium]|jgi:DNA polymerase-3 subunit epsilon|nr:exonuclease domain-containing protein [Flavobacteriaceae bacterium]